MTCEKQCALCLKTDAIWFLEVFSDDNKSLEISAIISKHLWFDLVPEVHSYVCAECWTNIHSFHLFYSKLQRVHGLVYNEEPTTVIQSIEYLLSDNEEEIDVIVTDGKYSTSPDAHDQNDEKGRPKRTSKIPQRYQSDSIYRNLGDFKQVVKHDEHIHDDHEIVSEDMAAIDTLKVEICTDTLDTSEQKESENSKPFPTPATAISGTEDPPKRRRGRPPKRRSELDNSAGSSDLLMTKNQSVNANVSVSPETKVKRGRGRPPKRKSDAPEMGTNDGKSPESSKMKDTRSPKMRSINETLPEISDVDYEEKLKLQKQLNMDDYAFYEYQLSLESRDDRIFKYIDEFFCFICEDRVDFQRFAEADRHYRLVHNEPGYVKCPKCDKKCCSTSMFVSHMETHEDPEKNKCNICGRITDSNVSLKKHMRIHQARLEENYPFPCGVCKRRFQVEEQREKHEKLHVPKTFMKKDKGPDLALLAFYKRIYCDVCEEKNPQSTSFDNFWDLSEHMGKEHDKTAYLKCPLCFKRNVYRPQLLTHIDMHNDPEKYRCEICKEIYQNLDKHMVKAHTPTTDVPIEKKHKCDQCGRMFNFLANLKMHMDCVHGSKDVRCNVCNKYFNYRSYLVHKRTAHSGRNFMCEYCPKMFRNSKALLAHRNYHNGNLLEHQNCKLCGKQIKLASMSKHMKTVHSQEDPVSCTMCNKTFRTTFHMKRHMRNTCAATIDSRSFKCEVCGKGFCTKLTMMEHMTTHTRTNQYQCAFCYKSFGYISNLYKHRKKAHSFEWQQVQARPEEGIATVIVVRN